MSQVKRNQEHFRGCLIGGAIGDALGSPVEFLNLDSIKHEYGQKGITGLVIADSGLSEITDDTQMTLFTAEGILRANTRAKTKGICHPPSVVYYAYQRWLVTQGYPKFNEYNWIYTGWLLGVKELHARRAPGNTCITALQSRVTGDIKNSINNSKGCGGVMRVAPVGLAYNKKEAFKMGVDFAAITHGHPSGYISAGALAFIIASIIEGSAIDTAVNNSIIEMKEYQGHEECTEAMNQALKLAASNLPDSEAISILGEGWVGEEALAIAVYCSLKYGEDFRRALTVSVNHSGDSDSTGAVTGNIVGAYSGWSVIPKAWIEKLELKEVILQIADDLLTGYQEGDKWRDRYPGY